MRALVTGAGGFVGGHLVAHLQAYGDVVTACDRQGPEPVDLLDTGPLAVAMGRARPDVVYHLAGFSDVGASWTQPHDAYRGNAEATLNLLTACRQVGVGRVIAISSAEVYGVVGEADLPLRETSPLRPATPYGASKVAAEFMVLQAFLGYDQPAIRVRPFSHIGPAQANRFVASSVAEQVALLERDDRAGTEIAVGDLSPRRDFTDVRDVVRAYRLLGESGKVGEVYNVCSGIDRPVSDVAEGLLALAQRPLTLWPDPDRFRPIEVPVLRGDASRLRADTGWAPDIPFEQTLADILDWWRRAVPALR